MPWTMTLLLALSIAGRSLLLGLTIYAVLFLDRSGWWFCAAAPLALLIPSEFSFSRKI